MRATFALILLCLRFVSPVFGQCPNDNVGPTCPPTDGSTLTLGVRQHLCTLWAGESQTVTNLVAGNTYRVDLCGILSDPAPSYNSLLTVYSPTATLVGFNDNFCGDDPQFDFVAAATGTYTILADISGNCSGTNTTNTPLAITLMAVGSAPEMDVRGNSVSILDGDGSPSLTDHTDFGAVLTCAGSITRTFTIFNTGSGNLTLGGIPKVVLGGANPGDFLVSIQPVSPVLSGGHTTFSVVFNPGIS